MAYYSKFTGKPPRRESVGPEEGYRPHGRARKTDGAGDAKPEAGRSENRPYRDRPAGDRSGRSESRPYRNDARPDARPSSGDARPGARPYRNDARPASSDARPGARPYHNDARPSNDARPGARPYHSDARPSGNDARPGARPDARPSSGDARPGARPYRNDARPSSSDARPGARPYRNDARPAPRSDNRPYRRPDASFAPRPPQMRPPMDTRPISNEAVNTEFEEDMPRENLLLGRNPIREAIKSGRDIEKLLVARGDLTGSAREIVGMAKEKHVIVQEVDRARLDAIAPNHQGLIAFASAYKYSTVEEMIAAAKDAGQDPFLVILDGVTDPHNLGAIIRTAECAGAHGVIVPERRAVGLTPAAVKASAGAVEHLRVARVGNLTRLIEELKAQGIWITSACMAGEAYDKASLTGPIALVIGAEGEGVSRLVQEHSDRKVAMPLLGKIESLNASVAAGILMYEVVRQRKA